MISLRDATWLTQASWLAVIVVGLLSFLGLLGLRFQRRGAARFWISPSALALSLLPAAVAVMFAALILRDTLATTALTGSGGRAAIAGGTAEALTPLFLGLAAAALLSALAFLTTAAGSSRSSVPPAGGASGWMLLAAASLALVLLAGTVATILDAAATLNTISAPDRALATRVIGALLGASALVGFTFLLAVVAAIVAPRGPAGPEVKAASLGAIAVCGLMASAGLWVIWQRSEQLVATATSGLADGEVPEPDVYASPATSEPGETPAPLPSPRTRVTGTESGGAIRVGGTIRAPRKLRNVAPVYPLDARQARVQGAVILEATISPTGKVTALRVVRGIPELDASAIEAVRQWVYEPTLLNGVAVPVIMTVTVNYRLSSDPPPSS